MCPLSQEWASLQRRCVIPPRRIGYALIKVEVRDQILTHQTKKWKGISLVLCSQLNGVRQKTRVSMIRHEWQRTSEIRHKTRVSVVRHEWQRTSEIRHKTRVSVIRHEWQGTRTLLQVSYVESPTKREVLVELRHKPKAGLFILDIWMKYSS